jgi:hypothetical protein
MELYIEPSWVKKDTRFKKGQTPWNMGKKGFTTNDPEKQSRILQNLADGRKNVWKTRSREKVHNSKPICAYDLDGNFVGVFRSASAAARELNEIGENIRRCARGERGRCGQYQFRWAKLVAFRDEHLVKKTPIESYKRPRRPRHQQCDK